MSNWGNTENGWKNSKFEKNTKKLGQFYLQSLKAVNFKGLKLSHLLLSFINQTFISYDVKVVLKNSVKERAFIATFAVNFTVFVNILSFYSAIKIEHQAINYKSEIVLQVLVSLSLFHIFIHCILLLALVFIKQLMQSKLKTEQKQRNDI